MMFRKIPPNFPSNVHEDKQIELRKIVCGGQTGVDRAALEAAISLDFEYGGWCPQGRIDETNNETGKIPEKYIHLKEISGEFKDKKENFDARTKQNIKDSDGTLIILPKKPKSEEHKLENIPDGTSIMETEAIKLKKPYLKIYLSEPNHINSELIINWVKEKEIKTLNIGGPRESNSIGIYQSSLELLEFFLHRCKNYFPLRPRA